MISSSSSIASEFICFDWVIIKIIRVNDREEYTKKLGVLMMSGMNSSHSARLFFWFLWLGGIVLGFYLVGQFIINTVAHSNMQRAIPYFLGFIWQCFIQVAALKSYQNSAHTREPLLIQLGGSLALIIIVVSILVLRS